MRFSGWSRARPMPTPCTRRAAGPRRRRASARPSKCRPSSQPDYPLLYSLRGFRYCDLLLADPERAAWQVSCSRRSATAGRWRRSSSRRSAVSQRAAQTLKWPSSKLGLLDIALDHLTLGRAALYAAILERLVRLDPCHCVPRSTPWPASAAPARNTSSPRPPHPRLAALSHRRAHRPRERAERPGRSLGNRRARPDEALPGRHPPPPRPPLLPRSRVSLEQEPDGTPRAPRTISPPPRNSSTPAATTAATKNSPTPNEPSSSRKRDPGITLLHACRAYPSIEPSKEIMAQNSASEMNFIDRLIDNKISCPMLK